MNNNWKKQVTLFLTSQAVSLFGSSIVQFAIVWYVTKETSSGLWVSMLTVCAYLPQFLISFFAGVWADRYSKKCMIIAADASIAVTTFVLVMLLPYVHGTTYKDTLYLGRIFGFFGAIYSAFLPIGMVVFGPLSDIVSMRYIMVFSGIALIVLGVVTKEKMKLV